MINVDDIIKTGATVAISTIIVATIIPILACIGIIVLIVCLVTGKCPCCPRKRHGYVMTPATNISSAPPKPQDVQLNIVLDQPAPQANYG